ncbi:MAG: hypothetical protein IT303_01770 [Dehalococcoidia bacterium]|nr:hypothetical protein [Dehalococcoidia bacterium]
MFPLISDDGRQHYVTLMQDTAGVVRVRVSLFSFAAGTYNVVLFNNGNCSAVGDDPGQVIGTLGGMELEGATTWVLVFFNTDLISLHAGAANSIADRDGTSLAIYRPGSGGSGLRAACGRLGEPPGPPASGSGMASSNDPGWWLAGFAVSAAGGALLTAMGVRRRR